MHDFLRGLRVIEGSAFVAAPLAALTLLQMGAEVIRFDTIGGGPDSRRWPRAPCNGTSLYWEGLNKGKKSIALKLSSPEGRELACDLVTAPDQGGQTAGLFVTNYPVNGFLAHEGLAARRKDLISVRVMGWPDGRNAVDYTINAALGYPLLTGPGDMPADAPVNHVMPTWDVATGLYAATALVCAERDRLRSGKGAELRVPLGDVARATLGNLGHVAEVSLTGADRPRIGNEIFGAFGRDFKLADGRRIMIVGLTPRQWKDLVDTLNIRAEVSALEAELGLDFSQDEGLRFAVRARLAELVAEPLSRLTLSDFSQRAEGTAICWAPYNTVQQALADPQLFPSEDPLFGKALHGSGLSYPTPVSPVTRQGTSQSKPLTAPRIGQDTEQVLAEVLGLGSGQIAALHDRGVVASARIGQAAWKL